VPRHWGPLGCRLVVRSLGRCPFLASDNRGGGIVYVLRILLDLLFDLAVTMLQKIGED
jgi:hypothetical protein